MIYKLDNAHIDLSKLEYVGEIQDISAVSINCFFVTQVNSQQFESGCSKDMLCTMVIRDNLIKAWKEYKEQR